METKYHKIYRLAGETTKQVTKDAESWKKYLTTAARLYKYPFEDQILIYAQKPEATACATMKIWNEKMFNWVNRGAKGIALIDADRDWPVLYYVFDVSDVHPARRIGKKPYLWKMQPEYEMAVLNRLEQTYGETESSLSFEDRLLELAIRIAGDYCEDLMPEIEDVKAGSFLEELDALNVEIRLRDTLSSSIAYTLLSRCGADMERWGEELNFDYIRDFNTPKMISVLGTATSELCRPILLDMGRTIAGYRQKIARQPEKNPEKIAAKNPEKGLEKSQEAGYNYNQTYVRHNVKEDETNETDIRENRGLSGSEPDSGRAGGTGTYEVRQDAKELSEGTPQRDLQRDAADGRTAGTLFGDTGTGRGEDGLSDGADGEVRGRGRNTESSQSHAVGSEDEQHPPHSGGERVAGTDLRLEKETESNQKEAEPDNDLSDRQHSLSGSFSSGENGEELAELQQDILCFDRFLYHKRPEIAGYFAVEPDVTLQTEYLKNAYHMEEYTELDVGEIRAGYLAKEDGLTLWKGHYLSRTAETHLPWEEVRYFVNSYIEDGVYLLSGEEAEKIETEGMFRQMDIFTMFSEQVGTIAMEQAEQGKTPAVSQRIPEEWVESILRSGGGRINNRKRIYAKYQQGKSPEEMAAFLQKEYGRTGKGFEFEGTQIAVWFDESGMTAGHGTSAMENPELKLNWRQVEERIRSQVETGTYMDGNEAYLVEKKHFPAADSVEVRNADFITQDEIDDRLGRGSGFTHGSFRIYEYFKAGHDSREAVDFLKKEYGTGGSTDALAGVDHSYEDHDAKGIKLEKGEIGNPYAKVLLSWNVVEKRIRKLIAQDKYLSLQGKKAYAEYKEKQAQEALEQAQAKMEQETGAVDFHITDDELGTGTPKEKFRRNVEAIRTLEKIEGEKRIATAEEQKILSKYVGWGGLADAFDDSKSAWANEYQELKELLSPEEYRMARESTLNAHYTSPVIVRSIYETLDRMGFLKGNILEPSMGIGNFFGMLPEKMKESRLYGVELDDITGRIARQLYPHARIQITGFEKTEYPGDFFDVAVGNVPFGQYKVSDRQYDKYNFLIHDYFFAKTLDKVRPGGVIAFVTSKGTMDKKSPVVRKYLAQRAELLGAVRLPNTAFKQNAGTEVTSDILFLKKRDRMMDMEPDWVHLSQDENGIVMNRYFVEHPEMIVGKMAMVSGPYGEESVCLPDETKPFDVQLGDAVSLVRGEIEAVDVVTEENELAEEILPADPDVKNYSYTLIDGVVYYRENSVMLPSELSKGMQERIQGMVKIRDCTQEVIRLQLEEYPEEAIRKEQEELNRLYDAFTEKYGLINSRTNKRAFSQDGSYCLLCSLEKLDDEGNFVGKADMFTKRTIKKAEVITSVDTASEALAVSLSEKARIDLDYMAELTGKNEKEITEELKGVIFQNPVTEGWETADEYLSGGVREKLETARVFAENQPAYGVNVQALMQVQPKELDASEIEVRIGATWIDSSYIVDFMRETFETPQNLIDRDVIAVLFSDVTGEWRVKGKNADYGNSLVSSTYGTNRRNAYQILEDSLNLKDSRVYDTIVEDGKEKRVLNKKETMIASQKQEMVREAFKDWIFRDSERRGVLVAKYNQIFNSTRPREYDGSHLTFPGMTPDIELKPHQKNAVAHILYGNNTLLAHCVGAGKTFEMVAAAMESKRLGLCQKSLFVVPNHLTEQWASDFLRLYPGANILAATKKDFEPANRKKFCSRIATGEYDAVIIGHSQFEKVPLSKERQVSLMERQMEEITFSIEQAKADNGERYTIKQMEKTRKTLQARLDKLNDDSHKDSVVTFEQLGVDRLFVDESHFYKNLFLYTKMRNVAGIAQSEAKKSSDMFAKCQYLDELTGGKGVTFATGTPISNSMTELYTNMRYLQYGTLQRLGLGHFDSWAASFGETQTAIELAPEGTGYRAKTRFAKFFNLPELIALFKECADIQTADMLHLPVSEAEYENVVLEPSGYQREMVQSLADRAEAVRDRRVDATVDNMLKITNDGRKLALDQRLINEMLPDEGNSKTVVCVENAFRIWEETKEQRSAQLIFCDLSTPKGDGTFNVYGDVKEKLMAKGVPEEEIAFIHAANTDAKKAELFAKVRSGQVRFLLGSTQKMGAGTNVQDRLIALHHLDVPWRPSDIEQQEGRILRQGNQNETVKIFRYVTEGTFDSYSWQVIENKQKFIGQIMTSKSPVRSCEDVDEAALTYAEVKALATGNPYIREKMDLDIQVSKLKLMKANHTSQKYRLEDNIVKHYPQQIAGLTKRITGLRADIQMAKDNIPENKEWFSMKVGATVYNDKKEAGTAIIEMCKAVKSANTAAEIGEYGGFRMVVSFDSFQNRFRLSLKGQMTHDMEVSTDAFGNITRINNKIGNMGKELSEAEIKLENVKHQLETAKAEVQKPFAQEAELAEKLDRLNALNALLNMDEKGNEANCMEEESPEEEQAQEYVAEQMETNQNKEVGYMEQTAQSPQEIIAAFRQETEKYFHNIDGMNATQIEQAVANYIVWKLEEAQIHAELVGVAVIGSRCRGVEHEGSDLDVVAEYRGEIREDALFDILHEDDLKIGGIEADINPITQEKTGNLSSYLKNAQEYMDRELAFAIADRYILIHETTGGFDYSILGQDYREIDGGVYENNAESTGKDVTIREALEEIVEDLKRYPDTNGAKGGITEESELVPVNYGELEEKVENVSSMIAYGYRWAGMLPVRKEQALTLYRQGCPVQKLYPDNTESYVQGENDLQGHEGMFGVEKADMEKYQSRPVIQKCRKIR